MRLTSLARRLALLGAAAACLVAPAGAAAGLLPEPEEAPKAELATTGNDGERLKAVPISKKAGARERVAFSLGPDQLKRIHRDDRIRVSGEVQVSTTCVEDGPRCVGTRYDINPTVTARIVLSSGADAKSPSFGLTTTVKTMCKQKRPNRNHHCTLVIPNTEVPIPDPGALPCESNACFVNLVVGAHHRNAKRGNKIVLGADRPDGSVAQDKGRLNVIQARAEVPPPVASGSATLVNTGLPLTEGKKLKRRVVYSVPIVAPRKGEVIAFDSNFVTEITGLRFNTFIATRVILAESPTSTDPSGFAANASIFRGDATEANGFNCTLGRSGYTNPCTVRKAGATRITKDVLDEYGAGGTLYLNVVASAKPLLAKKVKGAPQIALRAADGLSVLRYALP